MVLPWRGPVPLGMGAAWTPPPKPSAPCRCPKPRGCAEVGCSPPAVSSWKRSSGICLGWERGGSDSWGGQNPPGRSQSGLCCFPACHSQECHSPSPLPKKKQQQEPRIFLLQLDRGCFPMAFWDSGTGVGHRPPCWEARRWDTDICSTPMDTGLLLPDVVSTGSGSGCQHPAGLLDVVLPYVPCNPPGNWGVEPNSGSNPPISPNARGRSLENPNPIGFCEKFFLLGRGRESPTLCALGHGQEPGPPPVYATAGPT